MPRGDVVRRLLCFLLASGCLLAMLEILQLPSPLTPLRAISSGILLAGIVAGIIGTRVGRDRWSTWSEAVTHLLAPTVAGGGNDGVDAADRPRWRRTGWLMIATGVIWLLAGLWYCARSNTSPDGEDESAYLEVAREIHDAGGPVALVRELFLGRFQEANRHPLNLLLLSLQPNFETGKRISVACTVACFVLLVTFASRQSGMLAGGCLAILFGSSAAVLRLGTMVGCEPLLLLLVSGCWIVLTSGSNRTCEDLTATARWNSPPALRCASAGCLLGLSWLTKGTGLVFTAGTVLWLLAGGLLEVLRSRQASLRSASIRRWFASVALLAIVWLVVASPLLVRNIRLHGSVFYNVNSWLMFVDAYEDPVVLARQVPISDAAAAYYQKHTIGELIGREARGAVWEVFIVIRSLGPFPLDDGRVLFGCVLLIPALSGLWCLPVWSRGLLACWLLPCLLMFAWYVPIAAGERFSFPLLGPLLLIIASGISNMTCRLSERR